MKYFKLSEELGNKVLGYLCSRPYAEVYKLIDELQSIEVLPEAKEIDNGSKPDK